MSNYYNESYDCKTPADYGWVKEEDLPNIDSIKDFLQGIVESVYFSGNVKDLEYCLESICCELKIKIPNGAPKIATFSQNVMLSATPKLI